MRLPSAACMSQAPGDVVGMAVGVDGEREGHAELAHQRQVAQVLLVDGSTSSAWPLASSMTR